jgi:hypothetical protein
MPLGRATFVCSLIVASAACGSDVETRDGSGGDGATGSSSEAQVGSTTGGGGAPSSGSAAGGAACQPWEECACVPCDAEGGTCLIRCNFGAGYECFAPGPPAADQFSCGGFVNCANTEACIDVEQGGGDSCIDHFCAALPDPCAYDRSCACLAEYIDRPVSEWGTPTCTDVGGEIHVTFAGSTPKPPWDDPWCGTETCAGEETCWACFTDGDTTVDNYVCATDDPGPDGDPSCTRQWGEPPRE